MTKTEARRAKRLKASETAFDALMGTAYKDAGVAKARWRRLEAEHGARKATAMIRHDPRLLGRFNGFEALGGKSGSRKKAEEAFKELSKRRREWKRARDDLAITWARMRQAKHNLLLAKQDLRMMRQAVGPPERFRRIVLEKIKLRARALDRVTAAMIEKSSYSEERKTQMKKALKRHRERTRDRERNQRL